MSMAITEVRFSFLTSGPPFRLVLPPDFEALPELSSPLGSGTGGRSFVFYPTAWAPDLSGACRLLDHLTDRDGRTVELYERLARPLTWLLRWALRNGDLTTHLREEDGLDRAQVVVASLSIVEDGSGGTPYLLPEPPLHSEASATPGYQEFATFPSATREGPSVTLKRPSFLSTGQVMTVPARETEGLVLIRAGAAYGLEVQITSDTLEGGTELLSTVMGSLEEL